LIDQRVTQMQAEGVTFKTSHYIGQAGDSPDKALTVKTPEALKKEFDAVVLTGGCETPRDLPVTGRELDGVMYAMDFLRPQNKVVAGDKVPGQVLAKGKHVVVIGGGDTGSDCVGTSNRHGAKSVTPPPPTKRVPSVTGR
jgi:glutamate synthase (NADPH/NADH) small chain